MSKVVKYIFTDGFNDLEEYFFKEVELDNDVVLVSKNTCFKNKIIQKLFRLHFSFKLNSYLSLPFKKLWFPLLDKNKNKSNKCIYLFMVSWYYPSFYKYLRKRHPAAKIVLYFGDTIISKRRNIRNLNIEKAKKNTDIVYSYNPGDVRKYGLNYLPMCYSRDPHLMTFKEENWDVLFIGAARNRFKEIVESYNHCKRNGLKVFYYVVGKNITDLNSPDFIISDHPISMKEYLKYVIKSRCIWEIIDSETEGNTLRLWDAIMYNKYLITNNRYVKQSKFYDTGYIRYYETIDEVNFDFLHLKSDIAYNYTGENSPRNFIERISADLSLDGSNI